MVVTRNDLLKIQALPIFEATALASQLLQPFVAQANVQITNSDSQHREEFRSLVCNHEKT
jgi:hypothetical protein